MAKKSKEIGSESHVYDAQGNLEGLYTIDGAEVRRVFGDKRFWQGSDEIIRLYTQINPSEMKAAVIENTNIKQTNNNKYGSDSKQAFRQALNLPHGLYLALTDFEPRIFRDKKMRETFMKRYPNLRSCEVV